MPLVGRLTAAAVPFAVLAALAPAALAARSTASVQDGLLHFDAAQDQRNLVTVALTAGTYVVSDANAGITPGAGCGAGSTPRKVVCDAVPVTSIRVDLRSLNDSLTVEDSVPLGVTAEGYDGNDVFRGGPGPDTFLGDDGDDTFDGRGGADAMTGGNGKDTADYSARTADVGVDLNLRGGGSGEAGENDSFTDGTMERILGGHGDDHLYGNLLANVLNGGDGYDVVQGRAGDDSMDGGDGADMVSYAEDSRVTRNHPVEVSLDGIDNDTGRGDHDHIVSFRDVEGGEGSDHLVGNDNDNVILGGPGNDTLDGLGGDDLVDGGFRSDTVRLGSGNDTVVSGNTRFNEEVDSDVDAIDGEAGTDAFIFTGLGFDERAFLESNGDRWRMRWATGALNRQFDVGGIERFRYVGTGGPISLSTQDLSGTGLTSVVVDLAATDGGTTGDGQADEIEVDGGDGPDAFGVAPAPDGLALSGLGTAFTVLHTEPALDSVRVVGGDGDDELSGAPGLVAVAGLRLDGGSGADTLTGGDGDDTITGGPDPDEAAGGFGDDAVSLGDGDDHAAWNPGDGNDTIGGDAGADAFTFTGSNAAEHIRLANEGGHVRFTRDAHDVSLDLTGIERLDDNTLAGNDVVTVDPLGPTALRDVRVDLAGTPGGSAGDGKLDQVLVAGTGAADQFTVAGSPAAGATVTGLPWTVGVSHPDGSLDELRINTGAGADTVDSSALLPGTIKLFVDGTPG